MRIPLALISITLLLVARTGTGQVVDDFEDGNLAVDPTWSGQLEYWESTPFLGGLGLRSKGQELSDTLALSTSSVVVYGIWEFIFAYSGGRLSNFNQVRVHLMSSTPIGIEGEGYHLQIGGNSRSVRLYRTGGSGTRSLLASSLDDVIPHESDTLDVRIERTVENQWLGIVGADTLFSFQEAVPQKSTGHTGLWVKHSATRSNDYVFDDVNFRSTLPPDTTTPYIVSAEVLKPSAIALTFSEQLSGSAACQVSNYRFGTAGFRIDSVECTPETSAQSARLRVIPDLTLGEHVLIASRLEDISGNAATDVHINVFVTPEGESPAPADIVVNELLFDPPDPRLEFVELFNRSNKIFNLADFQIADSRNVPVNISGEKNLLYPNTFAVLAPDTAAISDVFGAKSTMVVPWPTLNNSGDVVKLLHNNIAIDSVAYTATWGLPDVSLERYDPSGPSQSEYNWGPSADRRGATPGRINSTFFPDVLPPAIVFAEERDADTFLVTFSEPIDTTSLNEDSFSRGQGSVVMFVVNSDQKSLLLKFEPDQNEALTARNISDLTGNVADVLVSGISFTPRPGDLEINEIMYDPRQNEFDGLADQPEYIELINSSGRKLSLSGIFLTDEEDEFQNRDTIRSQTEFISTDPGHYILLVAEPREFSVEDLYSNSSIVDAFPTDYRAERIALVQFRTTSLGLLNSGTQINVHAASGPPVSSITYSPDWHHPALQSAKGISLERIIAGVSTAEQASGWSSSVHERGGTPGKPNSITPTGEAPGPGPGITVSPLVFSPDGDGVDDNTVISYNLAVPSPSALLRTKIFDSSGRRVRYLVRAELSGPTGNFVWDGRGDENKILPIGIYIILLEAFDPTGKTIEVHKKVAVLARNLAG